MVYCTQQNGKGMTMRTLTLTEMIVDPMTGEVLGKSGETNRARFMELLAYFTEKPDWPWPGWFTAAYNSCIHHGYQPEDTAITLAPIDPHYIADEIDALRPGHTLYIEDHEITRTTDDTEIYTVDGERLGFYEAWQKVIA